MDLNGLEVHVWYVNTPYITISTTVILQKVRYILTGHYTENHTWPHLSLYSALLISRGIFPPKKSERHLIARPLGRGIRCIF